MSRLTLFRIVSIIGIVSAGATLLAAEPEIRKGSAHFEPAADEEKVVPEPFRMKAFDFAYEQKLLPEGSDGIRRSLVTFPSPVKTPHEKNNTVHCEYFAPKGDGKHPACVVLHILGGNFELSRVFCNSLARQGVAALFVKMPYYGERREPDVPARMVSRDPKLLVAGFTQAVLDIRTGTAWLAAQPEIDDQQLGIFGISLGGITAALAASAEPRLQKVCLVLAGGDVGLVADTVWDHPLLGEVRKQWLAGGGTRETLVELVKTIDPVTYADSFKGRKVLMLNASHDEIIPRKCTESLWRAVGQPQIVWYNAGHYTAVAFLFDALGKVNTFFAPVAEVKSAP